MFHSLPSTKGYLLQFQGIVYSCRGGNLRKREGMKLKFCISEIQIGRIPRVEIFHGSLASDLAQIWICLDCLVWPESGAGHPSLTNKF